MPTSEKEIQTAYASRLKQAKNIQVSSCCPPTTSSCCSSAVDTVSGSKPVIDQEISFGCLRLEEIIDKHAKSGMTVIDFGSGPGHDLFIAARAVGNNGKAIGVDMTDEMIVEARNEAITAGLDNVELIKASIENIPLADGIADIIISNCVINLASNKTNVFKEAFRLLKPGGMLLDADVIAGKPLSDDIKKNKELWCSCVGGALTIEEHERVLAKIGFEDISVELGEKDQVTFDDQEVGIYSGLISARKPDLK